MELIQFLRFRPELLFAMPSPTVDGQGFPSPRSWEFVVKNGALDAPNADLRRYAVAAAVGTPAMVELEAFLASIAKLPNIDVIVASPQTADIPKEVSVKYALVSALSRYASVGTIDAILQYLQRFKEREWVGMAVNDILRNKPELKDSTSVVRWLMQERAA